MAFVMPRTGTLDSIYALFTVTVAISGLSLGGTFTVSAQLYEAAIATPTTFNAVSSPVPMTFILPLLGIIAVGTTIQNQVIGLNFPMTAGNRYLMIFYVSAATGGILTIAAITGSASAGITVA
jgi:hypothetical protein